MLQFKVKNKHIRIVILCRGYDRVTHSLLQAMLSYRGHQSNCVSMLTWQKCAWRGCKSTFSGEYTHTHGLTGVTRDHPNSTLSWTV